MLSNVGALVNEVNGSWTIKYGGPPNDTLEMQHSQIPSLSCRCSKLIVRDDCSGTPYTLIVYCGYTPPALTAAAMPLYDVVVMLKASVARREAVDLVRSIGSKVLADGGVICDMKAYGALQLAYEIKKLDGWHQEVRTAYMDVSREGEPLGFGPNEKYAAPSMHRNSLMFIVRELISLCGNGWSQGQMFQMTVNAPPSLNKDLGYLNKDERLLRWMVVKAKKSGWLPARRDTGDNPPTLRSSFTAP